nr:MAG TPA: hypothetical protein [Bacteriophage sp.]
MCHLFNFFYFRNIHVYTCTVLRCSLNSFRGFQQLRVILDDFTPLHASFPTC